MRTYRVWVPTTERYLKAVEGRVPAFTTDKTEALHLPSIEIAGRVIAWLGTAMPLVDCAIDVAEWNGEPKAVLDDVRERLRESWMQVLALFSDEWMRPAASTS